VGNEFSSVEALWSQFEGVMAKEEEAKAGENAQTGQQQHQQHDGNVEPEEQKQKQESA
jgi:DASH complex subunit DAD1